jgi:Xaa-Pro aminopeptidase
MSMQLSLSQTEYQRRLGLLRQALGERGLNAACIPGLGGFRHSETAVITEDGKDILTYYPRDLESLTIAT